MGCVVLVTGGRWRHRTFDPARRSRGCECSRLLRAAQNGGCECCYRCGRARRRGQARRGAASRDRRYCRSMRVGWRTAAMRAPALRARAIAARACRVTGSRAKRKACLFRSSGGPTNVPRPVRGGAAAARWSFSLRGGAVGTAARRSPGDRSPRVRAADGRRRQVLGLRGTRRTTRRPARPMPPAIGPRCHGSVPPGSVDGRNGP
jgi:hypothetical protein